MGKRARLNDGSGEIRRATRSMAVVEWLDFCSRKGLSALPIPPSVLQNQASRDEMLGREEGELVWVWNPSGFGKTPWAWITSYGEWYVASGCRFESGFGRRYLAAVDRDIDRVVLAAMDICLKDSRQFDNPQPPEFRGRGENRYLQTANQPVVESASPSNLQPRDHHKDSVAVRLIASSCSHLATGTDSAQDGCASVLSGAAEPATADASSTAALDNQMIDPFFVADGGNASDNVRDGQQTSRTSGRRRRLILNLGRILTS